LLRRVRTDDPTELIDTTILDTVIEIDDPKRARHRDSA
jgi:hypothetical protein